MNDEVDSLEYYDWQLIESELDEQSNPITKGQLAAEIDELTKSLMFPWSEREPELDTETLAELDRVAELVEVMRLKGLGVLLPPDQVGSDQPKMLSTKFVITWRDKTFPAGRFWLRRARKVAREFNWLSEREDLFSPASSSATSRLLPTLFLHLKEQFPEKEFVMASADVTDAFLTVNQKQPTLVRYGDQQFALAKVLPGQRDGSQLWFESVTAFFRDSLKIESCQAYPSLLRSPWRMRDSPAC